ncbi:MAG: hypothetical protein K8U03_12730 [Planctomycetia bacterium]|nr:hypothetical protein [Planctomycetia bacterium]
MTNNHSYRLRAIFIWTAALLSPAMVAAQQAPAKPTDVPKPTEAPKPVEAPKAIETPPKPIEKVTQDKPVTVQPTPATKPTPDVTSPTAPSTSKVQPNGTETVAPGPSPIAAPGTLSSPPPAAPAPNSPAARPTAPKERYFMLVFGSQSSPKRAKYTHTWMTIVKAVPGVENAAKYDLTSHTISWLPRTLNVRILTLRGEPGVNLSLHQTLKFALCNNECLAMWGPYELDPIVAPQIYDKSLRQISRLNSGCVLYKAVDPDHGPRSTYISNCIHAVTDLDGLSRRSNYDELRNHGFDASQYLAGILIRSGRVDSSVTHEWVADALGLGCYPIQRRMIIPCRPPLAVVAE